MLRAFAACGLAMACAVGLAAQDEKKTGSLILQGTCLGRALGGILMFALLLLSANWAAAHQPSTLDGLWEDLTSGDAGRAYTAIWAFADTPAKTIPFFEAHVKPAVPADPKVVGQLIRDLGDNRFAVRKKANADLEKLGELAAHVLGDALKDTTLPLEARQRVDKLLAGLRGPVTSPEKLRAIRAVEALEYIGTAEARKLLERLAQGAPAARLTQEARESLDRLRNRWFERLKTR